MSESKRRWSLRELDELATLGASSGASALGMILGRDIVASAPRPFHDGQVRPRGDGATGVIFDAEGALSGLVALLLPERTLAVLRDEVVREPNDAAVDSALCEIGNMVASHTVSGIADGVGGSILLSVPTLVLEDVDRVLSTVVAERGTPIGFESELFDPDGELAAVIVFIPELASKTAAELSGRRDVPSSDRDDGPS